MSTIPNCLVHIRKIKRVAFGEDSPYVARSRLGRLTLSLSKILADAIGISAPDRPSLLPIPDVADDKLALLINLCNKITDNAKTLSQPSEPLDKRWRDGWLTLLDDLKELEVHLMDLGPFIRLKPSLHKRH